MRSYCVGVLLSEPVKKTALETAVPMSFFFNSSTFIKIIFYCWFLMTALAVLYGAFEQW